MKLKNLVLILICVTAANVRALAMYDAFIKLDGIDGEVTDRAHPGTIEVLSWSFEMSNTSIFASGGGGGAGKVAVHDLSITKHLDKATPNLMKACATGEHIKEAVLYLRRGGDKSPDFLIYTFHDVLVTSVSVGGSAGDDQPTESLSLNFGSFKVEYIQQGPKGKNTGTSFEWDLSQNKAN